MRIIQTEAEVLSLKALGAQIYQLSLLAPGIARQARPGQFVNILCGEGREHILRRPFSIYEKAGGSIEILFRVLGRGTSCLKESQPHSRLDVIGPLGRAFDFHNVEKAMLVAGGMGIAPLRLLVQELSSREKQIYLVIGAKDKGHLPFRQGLREMVDGLFYVTEDGSLGSRGLITDFLPDLLGRIKPQRIFSCGPQPMLKKVAQLALDFGVPCQVSLEEAMACGLGVCLSCVVPIRTKDSAWEYQRVCREGPVFNAEDVYWDET